MRKKVFPVTVEPEQERFREQMYDYICRHLVCLGVRTTRLDENGNSDGMEYINFYSLFVASVGER